MRTCTIDGCNNKYLKRGYCSKHYGRWARNGSPEILIRDKDRGCSVDKCEGEHKALGLCLKHYQRFHKYGDVDAVNVPRPPQKTGNDVSYKLIHDRLRKKYGSAKKYPCHVYGCEENSGSWSLIKEWCSKYELSWEKIKGPRGKEFYAPFSEDLSKYVPLCNSHHAKLDRGLLDKGIGVSHFILSI